MRSLQGLPKRDNECRRGRTSTIWDVNWKGEDLSDASIENRRNRWIKDKCQDTLEMWNFRPESRVHDSNWEAQGSIELRPLCTQVTIVNSCIPYRSGWLHRRSLSIVSSLSPLPLEELPCVESRLCPNSPIFRRACFDYTSFSFILKWFSTTVRRPSARQRPNVTNRNLFGAFRGWTITLKSSAFNAFGQTMGFISRLQTLIGRNEYYHMAWRNSPSWCKLQVPQFSSDPQAYRQRKPLEEKTNCPNNVWDGVR